MRKIRAITIGAVLAISVGALAQSAVETTLQDIRGTFGFVPSYFKVVPPRALPGAWENMKAIELSPTTALPGKTKELIGLGVAAQIPCKYCIYAHTQAARMHGATTEELSEATAIAALTVQWATVIDGLQVDADQHYPQEIAAMMSYLAQHANTPRSRILVTDAQSAYRDIMQTFGMVPTFLRAYPREGIASAWREFKAIAIDPNTALDTKTKALVALGVASQSSCRSCVLFATDYARLGGATDRELREAVAMAGLTRHWSTLLDGAQLDEHQFRADVDRAMRDVEQRNRRALR